MCKLNVNCSYPVKGKLLINSNRDLVCPLCKCSKPQRREERRPDFLIRDPDPVFMTGCRVIRYGEVSDYFYAKTNILRFRPTIKISVNNWCLVRTQRWSNSLVQLYTEDLVGCVAVAFTSPQGAFLTHVGSHACAFPNTGWLPGYSSALRNVFQNVKRILGTNYLSLLIVKNGDEGQALFELLNNMLRFVFPNIYWEWYNGNSLQIERSSETGTFTAFVPFRPYRPTHEQVMWMDSRSAVELGIATTDGIYGDGSRWIYGV